MITRDEIVATRARLGWSRRQLAKVSGLTEGKIWRIENKGVMSADEAEAIESALANVDGGTVPISPVRPTTTQPGPPSTAVDSVQPPGNLVLLEDAPPVEITYADLDCGHTTRDHAEADACPRHPRNASFRLHSNSELRTFKRCRRKWWLSWYRGLTSRVESPTGALAIGQRIHRALREWYVPSGTPGIDPRDALEIFITRDWTAVIQRYEAQQLEVPLELRRKFAAEADLERAMIEGYVQWLIEEGEDADLEVIAPETYVEVEVTDRLIPLAKPTRVIGKLDVRVRRRRDRVRRFIDHKTTGNFSQSVRLLPLDEQMLHYMLLEWLSTEEGEERCDAALYNMLRKVKRTARAEPPFYRRVTVHHSVRELESYRERLLATIEDVRLAEERLDAGDLTNRWAYPNPTKDCAWDCPFFQVCPMFDDGSRAEEMLEQYFQIGDPLDYYTRADGVRPSDEEVT
jgi:transcriptional regulator with XRE-family HTH domain